MSKRYRTQFAITLTQTPSSKHSNSRSSDEIYQIKQYLQSLLLDLDGVIQSPKFHPERDALYHSLQVFQLAIKETTDPELWAAALFHDVGKAVDTANHEVIGGEMLTGLLSPRITWLIYHHLHLLKKPKWRQSKLKGSPKLADLEMLRRWDLGGRHTHVDVMDVESAMDILFSHGALLTMQKSTDYSSLSIC